jgi:hypothetical protein
MTCDKWRIDCYEREVSKAEIPTMLCKIKFLTNAESVPLSDTDYKLTVNGERYPFEIKVSFLKTKKDGYGIELTSETFGCKPDEERALQTLFYTIYHKITWKKLGFLDNDEIPIQKTKVLRRKRHRPAWNKSSRPLREILEKTEPFRSADDTQSLRKADQPQNDANNAKTTQNNILSSKERTKEQNYKQFSRLVPRTST